MDIYLDAMRYRMLRSLVDYPEQMDEDLDHALRQTAIDHQAPARYDAKPDQNRCNTCRSAFA